MFQNYLFELYFKVDQEQSGPKEDPRILGLMSEVPSTNPKVTQESQDTSTEIPVRWGKAPQSSKAQVAPMTKAQVAPMTKAEVAPMTKAPEAKQPTRK